MADEKDDDLNWDTFVFSEGVVEVLEQGGDNWIDILSWDFRVNDEGTIFLKDVAVAELQAGEDDKVWVDDLVGSLADEGFF